MNNQWFYVLLVALIEEDSNKEFIHSRNRKKFHKTLCDKLKRLRQRRIPRIALPKYNESSWRRLLNSNNDQGMITLTGLDVKTFHDLNNGKFEQYFNQYSPFID